MELYGTLLENAVQFGCSSARARKVGAGTHARAHEAPAPPRLAARTLHARPCAHAACPQSSALKPRDMAVYLERSWGVTVPGFSGDQVRAHR